MKLLYLLPLIALSACSAVNSPNDMGTFTDQEVGDVGSNDDNGSVTACQDGVYYVSHLTLPTRESGMQGDIVGFNLDSSSASSCGITDWADGVDNSFMNFASAAGLDLRTGLSNSVCYSTTGMCQQSCNPNAESMPLNLQITVSGNCSQVSIREEFSISSTAFAVTENNGAIYAYNTGESFSFPFMRKNIDQNGFYQGWSEWTLQIEDLSFSAQVSGSSMNSIVLGGTLTPENLDSFAEDYSFADRGASSQYERYLEIIGMLDAHYDLDSCESMSIGILATASRTPVTRRCNENQY